MAVEHPASERLSTPTRPESPRRGTLFTVLTICYRASRAASTASVGVDTSPLSSF
jgi:hypothetical protein